MNKGFGVYVCKVQKRFYCSFCYIIFHNTLCKADIIWNSHCFRCKKLDVKREMFGAFERPSSVLCKHCENVLVKKIMLSDR